MLVRISLSLAVIALAFATTACSSLTRPDEIVISAEPAAAAKPAPAPVAAAPVARPAGAEAPPSGG